MKEAHLIGNGTSAWLYKQGSPGIKLTCNLPPFTVPDAFATTMVDFKMMLAINDGSVIVPGEWILGMRPKIYMEKNPAFYMKYAQQIKEFYTTLPDYVPNYTDLSCGHMACHYLATKKKPDVLNMYGFDSIFDFDLRSATDFFLHSDRDKIITTKLTNNWRAIWPPMFEEFPNINFVLHYRHNNIKIKVPKNVEIKVHSK